MFPEEHDGVFRVFEFHQFATVGGIRAHFKQPILHRLECCFQLGFKTCLIEHKQRVLVNLLPHRLTPGL